ncbi:MAG TPA: ATP-binding cassette domain-containing protein [Chthoniobacter sp.]
MAAEPLWQLEAVSLGSTRLREISASIPNGVTAIIGWSGAGKTSLLNLLAGFESPDHGTLHGIAATQVAWVPQNGGLWPHCTAHEHLEIAASPPATVPDLNLGSRAIPEAIGRWVLDVGCWMFPPKKPASDATIEKALSLLTAFDLSHRSAAFPHELSEGEQSRLAVARALAMRRDVLLMDEPLSHVDPARTGKYWQIIRDHLAATGASLVFSTHTPEIALGEAQHALCLRAGNILHTGPVNALYSTPPDEELMGYLGPGNWVTPEEGRRWLRQQINTTRCLRPEQLTLALVTAGPLRVEQSRFHGSYAEVELRHVPSNATRTFFHRPARDEVRRGALVQLTALLSNALP